MDFNGLPIQHGYLPPTHMPPGPGHMPPVSEQHMPPVSNIGQHLPPRTGPHIPGGEMGGGGMMMPNHYGAQGMYQGGAHSDLEFTELNSILVDGGDRFGVCALAFDNQELLWMGNQGGHVTSYYGIELQKYTSFQTHQSEDVRQIVPLERGILSLTQSSLNCSLRRGIPLFSYRGPSMSNMQCMLMTSSSTVLIGGHQPKVIELDIEKLEELRQVDVPEPGCAILRHSNKFICAGDTNGKVTLYDPSSLRVEHVLDAHSGTLSDFDIHGNLLVTCGFSTRHINLTVDRFLMVYDLRVMRAMAPIQVIIDPMFLRFVPTCSNRLAVVSQGGQFQLIETSAMTPASMMMYPINTQGGAIMSFDISPTCQSLAFGDSSGYMHLFAGGEHPVFNQYPIPTEFSDPVEAIQPIHITDELTPYSIIPMMYPTSGNLLSDWPQELCPKIYRKPKPIDPEILRSMKIQHDVGYAKNVGKEKRNQVPYKMQGEKSKKGKGVPESPIGRVDDPFVIVPKRYRKVDLKYSKLGLEDFDFRHYNKTPFAGLETDIPNAYCNGMLQVLYFVEPIRCTLLNHVCEKEFCLSCELGFLFHMFDQQKGQTCQASNFLRAFRTIPEAAALGLVLAENEENDPRINLSRLIQSWQRFLYQQVHSEMCSRLVIEDSKSEENLAEQLSSVKLDSDTKQAEKPAESAASKSKKKKKKKGKKKSKDHHEEDKSDKDKDPEKDGDDDKDEKGQDETSSPDQSTCSEEKFEERSIISDLLGIKIVTSLRCRCGQETQRQSDTNLINLAYPECFPQGKTKAPAQFTFADVVHHSLTMEQNVQAWCNICDRYQPHTQKKVIKSIPDVLGINCHIENVRDYEFWKVQHQILKQQKEDMVNDGTSVSISQISMANVVMCRYGNACRRNGCRFRHERDASEPQETNYDEDPDCQWIPMGLVLELHPDGTLDIKQVSDEVPVPKDLHPDIKYYEILATIFHIRDEKTAGNIISSVHVGETYHQRKENVTCTQWYLFNDFSILPIEKLEAVQCNLDWKVPCTIYFKRRYINKFYDLQVKCPIVADVLTSDYGLVNPEKRIMTFTPLENDEIPKKGDTVALDAEFVSLNQEESELRSDGTRSMIKPSHLAVARITCVRGGGDKAGEPFIDDYISTQEQVVDYLTQWSGIQPGDLDPALSTKHLTTLKSTYQKLRYLVDVGVTFLGHGLKKDFRVINITVPKVQITDTVQLFHIPRQRMISLKFLAWYFLKMSIQSSAHDSVEDSRTALQLYRKYLEISKPGSDNVRSAIKEMYEYGRKNQWKIPDMEDLIDNPLDFLQTET